MKVCENPKCDKAHNNTRFCSRSCRSRSNKGRPVSGKPRKVRVMIQLDPEALNYVVAQATASRMSVQDYCRKVLGRDTLVGGKP